MTENLAERIIMVTGPLGSRDGSWRVVERVLGEAGYSVHISNDRASSQLTEASAELKAVVLNPRYLGGDPADERPLREKVRSFKDELESGEARDASVLVVGIGVGPSLIREAFMGGALDAFTIAGNRCGVIGQLSEVLPKVARLAQSR